MKYFDIEARTVAEAIEKALEMLKVSRDDIEVQTLTEEKRGLFGMEGERNAKIRVKLKKKKA